jgi:DnaK suppressor protein
MPRAQKSDAGKQSPAKATSKSTAPASAKKPVPAKAVAPAKKVPEKTGDTGDKFLEEQRVLLVAERAEYTEKADELKAEADLLALESEPGDIQFDEEGGEGGTANVERELDLVLSAQARAAVDEIDRALAKIDNGTYGTCEGCGQPIPRARLKALPYAALCVQCKSGGLSRR